MVTPQEAAEKFATGWLNSKPTAITNYASVASALAQRAIDKKADLLANFTAAVNNGSWERGLSRYVGNSKMEDLYTEKLNSITVITDAEKLKVENSVAVKQYLETQLAAVLTLFENASSGETTVPVGITEVGLKQMLMSGIISFEAVLPVQTPPATIYNAVSDYMSSHYGWPDA